MRALKVVFGLWVGEFGYVEDGLVLLPCQGFFFFFPLMKKVSLDYDPVKLPSFSKTLLGFGLAP